MLNWLRKHGCRRFQAALEDSLSAGTRMDAALAAHLERCARCREAREAAELSGRLMRSAARPAAEPSEAFVARVMAAIREREARLAYGGNIWRPFEAMASRFALVAAMVLVFLFVYAVGFSPPPVAPAADAQAEVGALPEPPSTPATEDEVLLSLIEPNGI